MEDVNPMTKQMPSSRKAKRKKKEKKMKMKEGKKRRRKMLWAHKMNKQCHKKIKLMDRVEIP